MSGFLRLVASERLKLSKSFIWLLVPLSPLISLAIGMLVSFDSFESPAVSDKYALLIAAMATFHALLFLPIMTGILSAFVCRYEHGGGGWKQLLALPISRTSLFIAKFTVVAVMLAITQLLFIGAVLIAAGYHGMTVEIPWSVLIKVAGGGFLACLPLAALQLLASVGWSSFAAPLAINVALTIPNILIINSEKFAPFYPWAQPMLAILSFSNQSFSDSAPPLEKLIITVLASFIVFFAAGLLYFNRREA